jgi:flagellar protein FliO/FliZ
MTRLSFARGLSAMLAAAGSTVFSSVCAAPAAAIAVPNSSAAGSLLSSLLYLVLILGLIAGSAWAMKRFFPKGIARNSAVKIVGGVSLGGRERILVVEVADQWIVVGTAPGRVSALSTMSKPESASLAEDLQPDARQPIGNNFADWLKQTIDKRNGNKLQ